MKCWQCGVEVPDELQSCNQCGADLSVAPVQVVTEGDVTGGVIPYKNPKALIAYYLGILSGLPFIGLPLGITAFVLGYQGLQARKRDPAIKGSVHAGIGIGCGCLFSLLWTLLIVALVTGLLFGQ